MKSCRKIENVGQNARYTFKGIGISVKNQTKYLQIKSAV